MMKAARWGAWLAVFVLLMQVLAGTALAEEAREEAGAASAEPDLASVIQGAADVLKGQDIVSDWTVVGLARSGFDIPEGYIAQVESYLAEKDGKLSRPTDYERLALGVMAAGGDPAQVGGYDLIRPIVEDANVSRQGTNGVIFALIVLDAGDVAVPETAVWDREKLLQAILAAQNDDGGWALAPGGASSFDITSMAMTALAPYQSRENVLGALVKAVDFLSANQLDNGGFPRDSAEVAAQVIIALTSLGLDPADERFAKPQGNPLTYLLSLRTADGGFAHLPGETEADVLATEQALMALTSVQLLANGEEGLFRNLGLADAYVQVEGPTAPIVSGEVKARTALQALERLFAAESVAYETTVYSFGTSVDSVDGIASGLYGGWDGWYFAVKRGTGWIHPQVSLDTFVLEPGDRIVFYYSDNTKVVHAIATAPAVPSADAPFAVEVATSEWNWETNEELVLPAAGVRVTVGGVSEVTDASGVANFAGLPAGVYEIVADGYADGKAPTIVRTSDTLVVTGAASDSAEGSQQN